VGGNECWFEPPYLALTFERRVFVIVIAVFNVLSKRKIETVLKARNDHSANIVALQKLTSAPSQTGGGDILNFEGYKNGF
jgi:hypothetical protein